MESTKFASMELRQLKYFVNAATTLNFTEAARQSFVAQSTLSQQIKQLETELGVALFHRVGRHVTLTDEGRVMLASAQKLLHDADEGLQRLADMRRLATGVIRIGLATGLGMSAVITDALASFHRAYPGIRIELVDDIAPNITEKLSNHQVDFALTFASDEITDEMEAQSLFATQQRVVVSEHHMLAKLEKVPLSVLARQPLVLPDWSLVVRQDFERFLAGRKVQVTPVVEINVLSHILYMVAQGKWVTVLPDLSSLAVRGLVAIPLEEEMPVMPVCVVFNKADYQREAVKAFMNTLHTSVKMMLANHERRCGVCGEKFLV